MRIVARKDLSWKKDKFYCNNKYLGYFLEEHPTYEHMFYINTPTGKSLDFYNKARAKQHAYTLFNLDYLKTSEATG